MKLKIPLLPRMLAAVLALPLAAAKADDRPSVVLLAKAGDAPGQAALQKLRADLACRHAVTLVDFEADVAAAVPSVTRAKLLVIAQTPDVWPAPLAAAVSSGMDRGVPIVVLDAALPARTSSDPAQAALWQRLALAQGCLQQQPVSAELLEAPQKPGQHVAWRGVDPACKSAMLPSVPPRHVLEKLAIDDTGRTRAWLTGYTAQQDRIGQVAVLPLTSSAALASPDVRRLVLQAGLAITGNRDLIPAAGLPVVP